MDAIAPAEEVESFINKWKDNSGSERSNFQTFIGDLCTLLKLPDPDPGKGDTSKNAYVFERFIPSQRIDGSTESRYIDLYRRDCFVLEGKQTSKELATRSHQNAINAAVAQAERYVRGLPIEEVEHGRPPFIVVVDVGSAIYTYSEFSRTGGNYVAFPDPRRHEIRLEDLKDPEVQDRLRRLWLDPDSLDPSKHAARVTREVSNKLAQLAKSLERSGYDVERVASFLKRCLFTMFAEDVELLPKSSFHDLLVDINDRNPDMFSHALKGLWETMNTGGYSERLMQTVKRFNGGLFKGIDPIALNVDQIQMLIDASKADWRFVEPAIFGTLLERALDPRERHKLGAHYTPRAYVERLVMPTLIQPLRELWGDVRAAAETLLRKDKKGTNDKALAEVRAFHYHLCQVRVLDPACGSANFLYVALEHMKRLEGEVLAFISELTRGQGVLESEGLTVDPHQFLGLEVNPRAAAIAELVLWIGYLQWHYRLNDRLDLPEPILRDFKNIECRDALIEYDNREIRLDENGHPVTIWDGITMKINPTTGDLIPDESGRATVYRYYNPRQADWPEADYIIGNPPFIGAKRMRALLGDGYVDAVQEAWSEVPQSADFVMRWWHRAAELARNGEIIRFGFITTNSITQSYIRRAVEPHLSAKNPLSIIYAIPDHPWVESNDGASVRIAITVGQGGSHPGTLQKVLSEFSKDGTEHGDMVKSLTTQRGRIYSNLKVGTDVAGVGSLRANQGICSVGMKTIGSGFQVTREKAEMLGLGQNLAIANHIRPYISGRDFVSIRRGIYVIDFFGLSRADVQRDFPESYQHLLTTVKPERDHNRNKIFKEKWWVIGHPRQEFRAFTEGLTQYLVTVETMKHRLFGVLPVDTTPDSTLVAFGLSGFDSLGVLSSRIHGLWALVTGGRLGIGNDPRYNKTRCFETFPFPAFNTDKASEISRLSKQLEEHRQRRLIKHPELALTGIYNVLEKIRAGVDLSAKEKTIHQQALVSLLGELHDELDRVVFEAYGWPDLASKLVGRPGATTPLVDKPADQAEAEEELLMRLVNLNKHRAQEEAQGVVRWLRPEYQAPDAIQEEIDVAPTEIAAKPQVVTNTGKATFPKAIPEQLRTLREALAERSHTTDSLAELFKRKPIKSVEEGLQSLVAVGVAEYEASTGTWHTI